MPYFFICPIRLTSGLVLGIWLVLLGCGHKQDAGSKPAAETAPSESASEPASESAAPAGQRARAAQSQTPQEAPQPLEGLVDPGLTAQLKIFIQEKGRLPETFAEFAGARLDSVPRLPKGLRFAIDLASQEVKIVKQ